jgi:hypothetical protein
MHVPKTTQYVHVPYVENKCVTNNYNFVFDELNKTVKLDPKPDILNYNHVKLTKNPSFQI